MQFWITAAKATVRMKKNTTCAARFTKKWTHCATPAGELGADEAPFADVLLASLGRGATSCYELQEAAAAMVRESGGTCSSVTRAIARIGTSGKHPGNCERDLFRALSLPVVP